MVLSIMIGVARAAAIVLVTVLAAIFATIFPAIFTARGFIGLTSDGRCGKQGARDEQCSTQL